MADFRSPYNFVPTRDRTPVLQNADLGDGPPRAGFDRYQPGHLSGKIRLKLTAVTPLLAVDASRARKVTIRYRDGQQEGSTTHTKFPVRMVDGRPFLPPTSLKGMLRSAYEAITNSRFGVFGDHGERLGKRMTTKEAQGLVPARIESDGRGGLKVRLLCGFSANPARNHGEALFAAWVDRLTHVASGIRLKPGEKIQAWVQKFRKEDGERSFDYWGVRAIWRPGDPPAPMPSPAPKHHDRHKAIGAGIKQVEGWAYISGLNARNKHDERIFFQTSEETPVVVPLSDALKRQWANLIRDYHKQHKEEIEVKRLDGPPALGGATWSRHVALDDGNGWKINEAEATLDEGTLCYARVEAAGGGWRVKALYPVAIPRDLYPASPAELLEPSLRPATSEEEMSPADRLWGWANQEGHGAWRGRVRVGQPRCNTPDALAQFREGQDVPLAILGAPKPNQARFYVEPRPGVQPAYEQGHRLRGRKHYPHHTRLPDRYWDAPWQDRTQQQALGKFQEYRRPQPPTISVPQGQVEHPEPKLCRDDQNRSVLGWVRPGAEFEVELDVFNLSPFEAGALLWLLSLPEGCHHRFGGAKPLGLGSVRVQVEGAELWDGVAWKESFLSLEGAPIAPMARASLIEGFKRKLASCHCPGPEATWQNRFELIPIIKAFLRAARGFDDGLPIHYPRTTNSPNPQGENFKWFVNNNSPKNTPQSLEDLVSDRGGALHTDPKPVQQNQGGRDGGPPTPGRGQGRGSFGGRKR